MSGEDRPILFDREALILALKGDERIAALQQQLAESEEEWLKRVGETMLHSVKPVDQRKVDFMRGYFAGARYWTGGRLTAAEQRIALAGIHESEESGTDE